MKSRLGLHTASRKAARRGVCFITAGLVQSCSRGGGEDSGGHVLRETGTREEPGTLTQGAPVFPGSSQPSGDLEPTQGGAG